VWHDAEQVPIQIELTDDDKSNISNMSPEAKNYVAYPKGIDWEDSENGFKYLVNGIT
jgi:hypothetical protein